MRTVQPGRVVGGRIFAIALLSSVISAVASGRADAATRTWNGSVNDLWTTAGNWSPAGPLAADDDLVFPAVLQDISTNDYPGTLTVHSISFQGTHLVQSGGGTIALSGSLSVSPFVAVNFYPAISLLADQTWTTGADSFLYLEGDVDLGNRQWTIDPGANATFQSTGVNGTGAIVKNGSGVFRLHGASTFNGPVTINQGELIAAHDTALGFTDGTAAHATTVNAGGVLTLGAFTLAEALFLNGSGDVALSVPFGGGTLNGPVTLTSRSAILVTPNPSGTTIRFNGTIAGPGALDIRDETRLILGAAGNSFPAVFFTGTPGGRLRTLVAGALPVNFPVDLPAGSQLDLNGFSTQLSSLTGAGVVQLGASGTNALTVAAANATTHVFNGEITGAGGLIKTGAGELVLGGASTFTGQTRVLEGRLRITHAEALGPAHTFSAADDTHVNGDGILAIEGASPIKEQLRVIRNAPAGTPGLEIIGPAPVTLSELLELGTGAVVRGSGGGDVTVSYVLLVSSEVTLENVSFHLAVSPGPFNHSYAIGPGATLHTHVDNALVYDQHIAIAQTGTLALNGHPAVLSRLTGTGTVSLGTNGALTVRAFNEHTFGGTIAGSGTFKKTALADFTLAGPTTFTGAVQVEMGRLIVAHTMALAANAIRVLGATLVYDVASNPAGPIALIGAGQSNATEALYVRGGDVSFSGPVTTAEGEWISTRLRVDAPHRVAFNAPVAGDWLWTHGTGTIVFAGNGNTVQHLGIGYSNNTVPAGTVRLSAADAFPSTVDLMLDTGATFDVNGGVTQTIGMLFGKGRIALGAGSTLTLASSSSAGAFEGTLSGTGAFVANVPSLLLKGTHTLTGPVTVNGSFAFTNGTLPASVTVNLPLNGGAGFGPGTVVGPVTVNGEGFFRTGDFTTPGDVTVGGLTLSSTTTWSVTVRGGGPLLTVNGPVSLGGGRIFLSAGAGVTISPATPITLIANDDTDAIAGTFLNVPEGGSVVTIGGVLTVSYVAGTGNDMTATLPRAGYHLSEGATGPFFDTELLIANPNDASVTVDVTLLPEDGEAVTRPYTLAPLSRLTILVDDIPGFEQASFSTVVRPGADVPLVVERTMRWDASGYGAHTEKATLETFDFFWQSLFAEGAEGFFSTFLLLENPHLSANQAYVLYMRENDTPVERIYDLAPASRTTIVAANDPDLVGRSFGIFVQFGMLPGSAERAMYFGTDPIWTGGHASAGASAPSTTWFLAEGATGGIFDTFILVANPNPEAADVTFTFLTEGGTPATLTRKIEPLARMTINPAVENLGIAPGPVATQITATQPVIAERSQYWSAVGGPWNESHNSLGVTAAATKWGLAEGRAGGPEGYQTYVLLANTGTETANVTLKFLGDGVSVAPADQTVTIGGQQRVTVRVDPVDAASAAAGTTFGSVITSDRPIVVERAMYWNPSGVLWGAGTNATATRLP